MSPSLQRCLLYRPSQKGLPLRDKRQQASMSAGARPSEADRARSLDYHRIGFPRDRRGHLLLSMRVPIPDPSEGASSEKSNTVRPQIESSAPDKSDMGFCRHPRLCRLEPTLLVKCQKQSHQIWLRGFGSMCAPAPIPRRPVLHCAR